MRFRVPPEPQQSVTKTSAYPILAGSGFIKEKRFFDNYLSLGT